ncbi:MAG: hypothetical protein JNN03_13900 [Rubrivivax sp.]|nr:hypothetical protein [Rubrivivax sp.]
MKTIQRSLLAAAMLLSVAAVQAQGGPGTGPGAGAGPRAASAGPASASGSGPGPGARPGRQMAGRWGSDSTPGWALMTEAERKEHVERMRAMKSLDECQAYVAQHREQMAARAKERGSATLRAPRRDACAGLKP